MSKKRSAGEVMRRPATKPPEPGKPNRKRDVLVYLLTLWNSLPPHAKDQIYHLALRLPHHAKELWFWALNGF